MSSVSDALGNHGAPVQFAHAGKIYTVSYITQQVKAQIERWLRRLAYEDLYALRGEMPPDQYRDALAAITSDRARYTYLGEVYQRTISTPEGVIGLIAILFGCSDTEAVSLATERTLEVMEILKEVTLASMPRAVADQVRAVQAGQVSQASQAPGAAADPTPPAASPGKESRRKSTTRN